MSAGRARLAFERPKQWHDRLRRYRLFVDGVEVGCIEAGGSLELETSAGRHVLEARIDWASSPPLACTLAPGEEARFRVDNPTGFWGLLRTLRERPGVYLRVEPLQRAGPRAGGA